MQVLFTHMTVTGFLLLLDPSREVVCITSLFVFFPMKRTFTGISLKRPASRVGPTQGVDSNSSIGTTAAAADATTLAPPSPGTNAIRSDRASNLDDSVLIELPCVSSMPIPPFRKPILKAPGAKSPVSKKVEFVDDSEGSLSDSDQLYVDESEDPSPQDEEDPSDDKENRNTADTQLPADLNTAKPTTSPISKSISKPVPATAPVSKAISKPIPRITRVKLSDDDENEEEDDYDDGAGDEDNSGSDYDSDGVGPKRLRTGRITHKAIKASPTTRTLSSRRSPLTPLKVTISSKPLVTKPAAHSIVKTMMAIKKPFKVPTFIDPSKAPTPTRTGVFTLGAKRQPPVEAKAAHDYTMEGSIILHDPAWEKLDEAQREEERLLAEAKEKGGNGEEDTTPQVIIPKTKPKSKSIAEILGITKQEHPKVHVVVGAITHTIEPCLS